MEHVVDETELTVEEERCREWIVVGAAEPFAQRPKRAATVELCKRTSHESTPKCVVEVSTHRKKTRRGIARPERPRNAAEACRRMPEDRISEGSSGPRQSPPCAREGRCSMLAVTTQELVRPLTGERYRDLARRKLGERQESERRKIRKGLVHVPDQIAEIEGLFGERELQLVMIGSEVLGDEPGVS